MGLICVTSRKGGQGVSTVAANLANLLSLAGHKVALIDLTSSNRLKLALGVLSGNGSDEAGTLEEASRSAEGVNIINLSALSAEPVRLKERLQACQDENRFVIVDGTGQSEPILTAILGLSLLSLWVLTPEAAALATLPDILADFGRAGADHIVLNRFDPRRAFHSDALIFLNETFDRDNVSTIRGDEAVNEAYAALEPLTAYSGASAALGDLDRLTATALQHMNNYVAGFSSEKR